MRQVSAGQAVAPLQSLIGSRIVVLREQRGTLGLETRILVQAVKRNLDRFPSDFMFQMSIQDLAALRS